MDDIEYELLPDGCGFCAKMNGENVGEITFIKIGMDRLMINHTFVEVEYQKLPVTLNLVNRVVDLARVQHRKVLNHCPFARNVFIGHPEFDDVLLVNSH
ncbi:MAG: N-acetyltransferase [Proteobacteria bacterium]|nr:N-acetyltransferase [Candidatus Enterousia onthequi]MCQ2581000.1 N-acetyltransferase [Alphaproteobacteria bacterium]